jgi:autotransporter-associated beta strand protein
MKLPLTHSHPLLRLLPSPLVALTTLLCLPSAGSAQSILLSAGNFTLLGGTAITSTGTTGTTIKNGNVGLSPGATSGITGFPPAVVTGGAIIATGAVTAQARLDLISASVALANMASNANMSNVDLGGKTLSAGVYTFNAAASLNGALTLDAHGQNNVTWVFQIGTALTTSINSTVNFINLGSNGGKDLGVFWNAGSAINIGANNQIAGNYLAGTSIVFGSLANGGGRGLALAGISLDNDIVNATGGPGGGDFSGGLIFGAGGVVVPPAGSTPSAGSLLISATGTYAVGPSGLVLVPGVPYVTTAVTADGNIADGSAPASLTVTSATATLTGVNTYTGGTFVNSGTLITTSANLPVNQNVSLTNGSTLIFNQAADGAFGGNITGGGTIQKKGAGALTLANATTSALDLQAGSLFFNGGLGATTIYSGALLGGNGTITGNLVNNGILSPGFSPGAVNVTGNYNQGSTGTLLIQLASGTSFDQLTISGTATLAGTLQVDLLGGFTPAGQSFTFLTATGGVSGTFGTITGNAIPTNRAAVVASVNYSPTAVTLAFAQVPFSSFGVTPNQIALGGGALANSAITTALDTLPRADQFPAALNTLSPQGYEIWSDAAFAHASALSDRLVHDDRAVLGRDDYYFDVSQRRGRAQGDLDVGSSYFTSTAGLVGGNHFVNPDFTVGGFFEHGKTTGDLGSPGSSTTIKDNTFGGRVAWTQGTVFARGLLAYGLQDYQSTRPVAFPGTTATATSSTKGHQWTADISGGEHFQAGAVTLSPFAGILMSRWEANGFTEAGADPYNITVARQTTRSLRSQLGLESGLSWSVGAMSLQPHIRAAWLHEFSNDARAINASFGAANYAVSTRKAQRDIAAVGAGVDLVLSPSAVIYTEYSAQTGGTIRILSEWRVGVAMRF